MFDSTMRVLIANRGEIAVRIARTCRDLGLPTVALHTDIDADAPHVRACDEAAWVPSYLDIEAVVARARAHGCWAVHPGYGFLSERPEFAAALEDAGLVLVGPSAKVMELMGRKDAARDVAVAAGVPVVPSYALDDDPASFAYPVLVKAAAGGGGKGMRVVRAAAELPDAIAAAKREAASAFGDDTLLIEKYVERGRHIEVQVIGDSQGTVLHLGTRECSVQRRHQKVIEEAPAPALDDDLRERIHAAAVALSVAVDYTNAGTIEFLLDAETDDFYFLEMNTRLQVEHPVTEIHSGVDLVELQLAVAAGEPLPFAQSELTFDRHALEARIYAEDAYGGFLPQAGTATLVSWPAGARVDHALESGQVVSTSFDPMLGKVIVEGRDREQARRRLVQALDDTVILGLTTNTGFLRELAASADFAEPGGIDTAWLDRNEVPMPDPAPARELAARLWLAAHSAASGPFAGDGFRMGAAPAPVVVEFTDGTVTLSPAPADSGRHTNGGRSPSLRMTSTGGDSGRHTNGGRSPSLRMTSAASRVTEHQVELALHGQRYVFTRPDAGSDHGAVVGDGTILAPMPGTVVEVLVGPGDQVEEGTTLGVVEAMKMELALKAPFAGVVSIVAAASGQQVALGEELFVVAPDAEEAAHRPARGGSPV